MFTSVVFYHQMGSAVRSLTKLSHHNQLMINEFSASGQNRSRENCDASKKQYFISVFIHPCKLLHNKISIRNISLAALFKVTCTCVD